MRQLFWQRNGKMGLRRNIFWRMMPDMKAITVEYVIDTIGRAAIMERFGVGASRVRSIRSEGFFPASWMVGLEDMIGHPLPRHLFSFKAVRAA